MSLALNLTSLAASAAMYVGGDACWQHVMWPKYRANIQAVSGSQDVEINPTFVFLSYFVLIVALWYFLWRHAADWSVLETCLTSIGMALLVYAAGYNWINQATFARWDSWISLYDISWGVTLLLIVSFANRAIYM